MNILLTGATGFIGSHIVENLLLIGHNVYATCRETSNFDKCNSIKNQIVWLNIDANLWQNELQNIDLDILIHTAWSGVTSGQRNDWELQLTNFEFSKSIFEKAVSCNVKKIICLGSQAEYGEFNYKVTENHVPNPIDAYGAVKLLTMHYLRSIAQNNFIEWYWLRVFSILGVNESETWLIPQVMTSLLAGNNIELTEGKQCYDYLFIDDFIQRLNSVISKPYDYSGVYNICSGRSVEIKHLLQLIAQKLEVSEAKLKFGKISYRPNQQMFIVGSPDKFENVFGTVKTENLEETVSKISTFYKNKKK